MAGDPIKTKDVRLQVITRHGHQLRAQMWAILLVAFCVCLGASASEVKNTPDDSSRWLGALEGSAAGIHGASIMYDLRFDHGAANVEKSIGMNLLKESFRVIPAPNGFSLSATGTDEIPELSGVTFERVDSHHLNGKLKNGVVLALLPSVSWVSWLHYAFFFIVVLFLGNEACRRIKWVPYILFFVCPIVLIPLWLHAGFDGGLFRWAKLYSSIAGCALFTLFRFNGLDRYRWAKIAVAGILAINIAEAVAQDFKSGSFVNVINAIAGILNIVTITRWMGIKRDEAAPHDMLWPGMTVFWILAYDAWNLTFGYMNLPSTVFFTLAIVVVPTLAAVFIKKGSWLQARAYTLAIYMIYLFSFRNVTQHYLGLELALPLPRNPGIALTMAIISIGSNLILAALYFNWKVSDRAPSFLQIGQNPSVI